jgi:hypothetical protein
LVTLNDPVYAECGEALVDRAIQATNNSADQTIAWMVRAAIGTDPTDVESKELNTLYKDLSGKEPTAEVDRAAMIIVANTILNMDKALTK